MPNTISPRGSSREKLLEAAGDLISLKGVHDLTLDAVAAAAGVTKGGLIYHFKTKDDLLSALVERMIEHLDQRSRAKAAKSGATKSALLLAFIDDTFDMSPSEKQLLTNLLSAASSYPHLLGPVRAAFMRTYGELSDTGKDAGLALVLAVAMDGISLIELLGLHQFTKRQRDVMRKTLKELIAQVN